MEAMHAAVLALCTVMVFAQDSGNSTSICPTGYWGTNCVNFCGHCNDPDNPAQGPYDRKCDPITGKCTGGSCQGSWTGDNCDQAFCDGGCNGGQCIVPGVCGNCPDISHVSPGCTNIKLRGLLGSLTAFAVLICSLIACGLGTVFYERRKNTSVSL